MNIKNSSFKIILFTAILILSLSCQNTKEKHSLKTNKSVTFSDSLFIQGRDLNVHLVARRLGIIDSLLLVGIRTPEHEFCLYNPSTGYIIKYFGRKGKGPAEFSRQANYFGQVDFDKNGLGAWIYDRNYRLLRLFSIDLLGKPNINPVTKEVIMPGTEVAISTAFYCNDSCIAGTSFSSNGQFYIYNPHKDTTVLYNFHPQKSSDKNRNNRTRIFAGVGRINPSHTKIGLAYLYLNQIDIFDISSKTVQSISVEQEGGNVMSDDLNIDELTNKELGYFDLFISERSIYALKIHATLQDFDEGDYNSEIHVFNLDGTPKIKYILDRSNERFVIDEEKQLLYAGHYNTNGTISVFKLNH